MIPQLNRVIELNPAMSANKINGIPEWINIIYLKLSNWYGYHIKPNAGDYQYYIGEPYLEKKDYKKAEQYLNEGLKCYPNEPELNVLYADVLVGLKQPQKAKRYYQKALKLTTDQDMIEAIKKKLQPL